MKNTRREPDGNGEYLNVSIPLRGIGYEKRWGLARLKRLPEPLRTGGKVSIPLRGIGYEKLGQFTIRLP